MPVQVINLITPAPEKFNANSIEPQHAFQLLQSHPYSPIHCDINVENIWWRCFLSTTCIYECNRCKEIQIWIFYGYAYNVLFRDIYMLNTYGSEWKCKRNNIVWQRIWCVMTHDMYFSRSIGCYYNIFIYIICVIRSWSMYILVYFFYIHIFSIPLSFIFGKINIHYICWMSI